MNIRSSGQSVGIEIFSRKQLIVSLGRFFRKFHGFAVKANRFYTTVMGETARLDVLWMIFEPITD